MTGVLTSPTPCAAVTPSEVEAYRKRVRAVIAAFAPQAQACEDDGHLPRELFTALGDAEAFSQRWWPGPLKGLPYARALVEELAPVNGGAALAVSLHCELFVHALLRFGGEPHAGALREALAGRLIGCMAITESQGGSDVPGIQVRAALTGDSWHLTGAKRYTTNLGMADNVLVLAKTGTARNAYVLLRVPLRRPGVRVTGFFGTLGMRSADTGALELDAMLPADHAVGRPGNGLAQVLRLLDYERVAATAALIAGARHALGLARAYMRTRSQFGKRLYDHQALAHAFADRWADVEAAAALLDATCSAGRGNQIPHHMVAAAKLVAARNCSAAIDHALQVFGGRGYTDAYPLERYYRDARLTRIGGGTDEMMREIISTALDIEDPRMSSLLAEFASNDEPVLNNVPAAAAHERNAP
jgi:alkylation response protein AidB-like acyl-CoA dehydrogenase